MNIIFLWNSDQFCESPAQQHYMLVLHKICQTKTVGWQFCKSHLFFQFWETSILKKWGSSCHMNTSPWTWESFSSLLLYPKTWGRNTCHSPWKTSGGFDSIRKAWLLLFSTNEGYVKGQMREWQNLQILWHLWSIIQCENDFCVWWRLQELFPFLFHHFDSFKTAWKFFTPCIS